MNFTDLSPEEAAFIVRVIGQLPTESRAFPLYEKLAGQFNAQRPADPAPPAPPAA